MDNQIPPTPAAAGAIPTPKYKLRQSIFGRFGIRAATAINRILAFFSLRKTKQFWGIVYDSVTKQPLDPVIVKLLYADGREIETCVTDLSGRYGFLASPGKFKIFARKTNYVFPSKYAAAAEDGIYENLYHGEFFELFGEYEVVAPNIPMDPGSFDWNQKAKQLVIKTHPYFKLLVKRLIAVVFWFGFLMCAVMIWRLYPRVPYYLYAVAAVYILLFIFAGIIPEARLWGRLIFKNGGVDMSNWVLELNNPRFPGINFGRATSREDGKFLLRANKGKYRLNITKKLEDGQKVVLGHLDVKIGENGVLNAGIIVRS
jgi:hypothetical protein